MLNIKLNLDEVREYTREIIEKKFQIYFSQRQVAQEILAKKYKIPLKRIFYHMGEFRQEQHSITRQLNTVFRELADKGIISKYSRNFWKKREGGNGKE